MGFTSGYAYQNSKNLPALGSELKLYGTPYRDREEASPQLQQKLLNMVDGNRQEAEKLVYRAQF